MAPVIAFAIGTVIAAGKWRAVVYRRLPVQKDIDDASGSLVPALRNFLRAAIFLAHAKLLSRVVGLLRGVIP